MKRCIGLILALLFGCNCATTVPKARVAVVMPTEVIVPEPTGKYVNVGDFDATLDAVKEDFERRVAEGQTHIDIRINSFGGSIIRGLDFIQALEDVKREHKVTVTCLVDSRAYSMGFVFLQSDVCDWRAMTKRSTLLAHNGSTKSQGNGNQLDEDTEFLKALDVAMAEIAGRRLKIGVAGYRKKIEKRAWTMAWSEALQVGAVDEVLE